ncbi:MAG: hypothetical protein V1792_00785 [Pseudomonadota bacterium]
MSARENLESAFLLVKQNHFGHFLSMTAGVNMFVAVCPESLIPALSQGKRA